MAEVSTVIRDEEGDTLTITGSPNRVELVSVVGNDRAVLSFKSEDISDIIRVLGDAKHRAEGRRP
jgi:hypothetical protein